MYGGMSVGVGVEGAWVGGGAAGGSAELELEDEEDAGRHAAAETDRPGRGRVRAPSWDDSGDGSSCGLDSDLACSCRLLVLH